MVREMIPVRGKEVRESLSITRAQVAREAKMQPGTIAWIEEGRFIPYETQLAKIAKVYRKHGWKGNAIELLEETNL